MSLGVLLSFALVGTAGVVGWTNYQFGQLRRYHVNLRKAAPGEPENFLITGSDSRSGIGKSSPDAGAFINGQYDIGQRSDSIMVLRLDPKAKSAKILSIPRDLYVPYAGHHGRGKINGAFAISPQVLTDTISEQFGISINHFIQVDFLAFQKLVNAIGGLPAYFDTGMRDSNTGLNIPNPGCVKLDGVAALAFARSRHMQYKDAEGRWVDDNANDFGRMKRQQFLVRHAIARMNSQGYTTNPAELNRLLTAFVQTVKPDQGLGIPQLLNLSDQFKNFDPAHLQTFTLPTTEWNPAPDGSAALRLAQAQAQPILNEFRDVAESQAPEAAVPVEVYNGSGAANQAANVAGALQQVGFHVLGTGNAAKLDITKTQAHTQVRYASGSEANADLVARHLTVAPQMIVDPNVPAGQVDLVTGADFTTVDAQAKPRTATTPPAGATTTIPQATPSTPATEATTTTELGKVPPEQPPPGVRC